MLFLWNVACTDANREVNLEFYDSSRREIVEFSINDYKPYFLTVYPLSKEQEDAVATLQGEVELVKKRSLFTDETVQLAKVTTWTPTLLKKLSKQFTNVWETEIEYGKSYIYDNGLVFGVPYTQQGDSFVRVEEIPESLKQKFDKTFEQEKKTNPLKHAQITEWFNLCHQPAPTLTPEVLGTKKASEAPEEQIYLAFLLARTANIPVPEAFASRRVSDWIKSMIYTYLRRNNVLVPTSKELRRGLETHAVQGALTIEPESGIYFNTVVCDFESLYPSCIDSYNLSYETVDCPHEECRTNKISEVEHHICTKRKGFYSLLIGALKDLRIRWFKPLSNDASLTEEDRHLAKAAAKLLKLISVSSYGVTVRIHGVACPPLAESITGYGRWALQTAWEIVKEKEMHPIYGDTDSIFLDNPSPIQVQALIDTVKKRLNLDLALEKQYTICVLPKAKKAYFGITTDGTSDLKGLTAIKSNAPKFVQNVFRDCVEVLSHVKNMKEYAKAKKKVAAVVHDAIKKLQRREVNLGDLIYSVQLYYDPNERTSATNVMPQPYQCALQLIDTGEKLDRRDTVHFIKVKPFNYKGKTFTVKPVGHIRSLAEVNVDDYIRNLNTALEQTFEPMGIELKKEVKLTEWFKA
ncbi:MAG: DNA polymerase domain-containing protein [Candidatus Bathyarchaeia archaeon]